jgi:hypothetical protein
MTTKRDAVVARVLEADGQRDQKSYMVLVKVPVVDPMAVIQQAISVANHSKGIEPPS